MLNRKIPLSILSSFFGIAMLDVLFGWYLADGFYDLAGLFFIVSLVWLWIIESKE